MGAEVWGGRCETVIMESGEGGNQGMWQERQALLKNKLGWEW